MPHPAARPSIRALGAKAHTMPQHVEHLQPITRHTNSRTRRTTWTAACRLSEIISSVRRNAQAGG